MCVEEFILTGDIEDRVFYNIEDIRRYLKSLGFSQDNYNLDHISDHEVWYLGNKRADIYIVKMYLDDSLILPSGY